MTFWEVVWFCFLTFALFAYLMVLFRIFGDLFRDPDSSGFVKAVWIIALVLLPLITSLVYVIVRGKEMTRRDVEAIQRQRQEQETYIRDVAGGQASATEEIARAREMLDAGLISQPEYERLKEKALV